MELSALSATELKRKIAGGETTCVAVMESVLAAIDRREGEVQAYITLRPREELLAEARAVDARRASGEAIGALAGLPVAVKDNICTEGVATTCASKMLADYRPPYDATVTEKLRAADGILLGKTNMDEFAMGSSTENSAMKTTRNPRALDRVPGGTSGGSAAAVAADEAILALGTDTGGSIRQPASFCGVVGMKPTYGRVSRFGVVAYGSSLDQVGPVTRSVADAALLLGVIAGHDARDSTSLVADVPDYAAAISNGAASKKYRVGVPKEYLGEGLDPDVRACIEHGIDLMRAAGHEIVELSLPHTQYAVPTYYLIACAEASSNLARYDGIHYGFRAEGAKTLVDVYKKTRSEGFGDEVKRRIMLGTHVLSAGFFDQYYLKALKVRTLIKRDFEAAFERCDVIAGPVAPTPAFKIGENVDDPLKMYLGDIYSTIANLVGIPAISVPCGETPAGLPVGLQFSARHLGEATLLAAAAALERLLAGAI